MAALTKYVAYASAAGLAVILVWLIRGQIIEYNLQSDPILHTLKEIVKPITFNGKSIADGMRLYKADKSFTINKSQTFLCLKDKEGYYYPLNQLVYVLLHERAHSLNTADVGHTEAFYKVFDELLEKATQLGIYNPNIPIIQNYCE